MKWRTASAASANFANSAAIGYGAEATQANEFVLGNADNTYTLAGFSDDVADGTMEYLMVDGDGMLSSTSLAPPAALSAMEADMEAASVDRFDAPEVETVEPFAATSLPDMPDMEDDLSAMG